MRAALILSIQLLLGFAAVCSWRVAAQSAPIKVRPATAKLKLRLLPDKQTYFLHQSVIVQAEFTNLSKETLCFPEPAQEYQHAEQGSVTIKAMAPPKDISGEPVLEEDYFIDHYDGGGTWPREKLVQEIKERWIWLTPNATYVTKPASVRVDLSRPGQWRLEAKYLPPEGAFQPAAFRKYIDSAALEAGCGIPHSEIAAEPAIISVSPPDTP